MVPLPSTARRRRQGNQEKQVENVYAEEKEQERHGVLENVSAQLSPSHPICYDPYCLCNLSRDKKLDSFSVVILKEILRYFAVPFASRCRKKNLVGNLSTFLEGCECRRLENKFTNCLLHNVLGVVSTA